MLWVLVLIDCIHYGFSTTDPWDLPILSVRIISNEFLHKQKHTKLLTPMHFPSSNTNNNHDNKHVKKRIPRKIWIGMKTRPNNTSSLPSHVTELGSMAHNDGWELYVLGHTEQREFLENYFANTSVLWAYNIVHPKLGVSACDIWRYAMLYAFGGMYLDDDSMIRSPLESIVHVNDSLIISTESGNIWKDQCYISSYHLSQAHWTNRSRSASDDAIRFLRGTICNWGIFAKPRHPVILRILTNAVEAIRLEYLRQSILYIGYYEPKWKLIMCATGPSLFTTTLLEMLVEDRIHNSSETKSSFRLVQFDFRNYQGEFKVHSAHYFSKDNKGGDNNNYVPPTHYMITIRKENIPLLGTYIQFRAELYEGKVITLHQSRKERFYRVENNLLRYIPDYYTLDKMGYDTRDIIRFYNHTEFDSFKMGTPYNSTYKPNDPTCRIGC